jgi:hypothetical protein
MRLQFQAPQPKSELETMIFRFEVSLLSGPVTRSFVDRNPEAPSRVIDIRGSQTLDKLHEAIFLAFDRDDHHMYEFQLGAKKPMDRQATRYGIVLDNEDPEEYNSENASIAALNLKVGISFFYWFDFGDDWWHKVQLLAVEPLGQSRGRYPRIVEKKGESPPQYIDWDEEENSALETARAEGADTPRTEEFDGISALMKEFCEARLTENYAVVCEKLLDAACASWLPLQRGKPQSWAAALVHLAGKINFLHDPASEPHMKLHDIAQHFGVSQATMKNKSREVRDAINCIPLDPRFCLSENLTDNLHSWLKGLGGILVDRRAQPREIQETAFKTGLIPFMPEPPAVSARPERNKDTERRARNKASS